MPDYRLATRRAASQFGVDPGILLRLIQQESGFNPNARSPAGAQGIAQFMPPTAKAYGVNLNDNRVTDDLQGAARYLRANLDKYGSYTKALSVYNSGRPEGYKSIPETANYVRSILGGRTPSVPSSSGAPSTTSISAQVPQQGSSFDPGPQGLSTLAGLIGQQASPPVQVPQAPHAVIQSPVVSAQPADSGVGGLLDAIRTPAQELPATGQQGSVGVSVKGPTATAASTRKTGVTTFEGQPVAAWIKPELEYARAHGWKGTVESGFRSFAEQSRIYNSGTRPAAKPGTSNHEGTQFPRGAIDVTDASTLASILRRKGSPLVWAGRKDPVHFSHPHGGSY